MYYLLFYEVVDNYVEKRIPFRSDHLVYATESVKKCELVLGGALADPVDGAILLFTAGSPEIAENFAKNDPYVINGLIKKWHVRKWTTVVGSELLLSPENQLPGIP
jgi:uncharacterized protein YciI